MALGFGLGVGIEVLAVPLGLVGDNRRWVVRGRLDVRGAGLEVIRGVGFGAGFTTGFTGIFGLGLLSTGFAAGLVGGTAVLVGFELLGFLDVNRERSRSATESSSDLTTPLATTFLGSADARGPKTLVGSLAIQLIRTRTSARADERTIGRTLVGNV